MEKELQPHDLDVFELTRSELNILLHTLGQLPYNEVSANLDILKNRAPVRFVSEEQLLAIEAEKAKQAEEANAALNAREVNPEAAADMAEASGKSEEEIGTEQ